MAVEVGQVLDGKYRIVRLIGKGGMGAVYEAEHLLIDRRVAVKELLAEAALAEHAITRFEREARAAGRIGSDHILQIFDVGVLPDGSRYMVSELLDGETLAARIHRVGLLTPAELLPIAQQLLVGLGAAHDAGVLHRDLKPDNIFLVRKADTSDFVKIIDFGIAKFQHGINQEDALKMTKTGTVVGTPYYLSPEQARGTGDANARSDLYSVGVILYECLTGRVPFDAVSFNDLIFKIVLENPEPPAARAPGIDQQLSNLVMKAMARDPALRFQSAQDMLLALSEWAASAEGAAALALGPRPARAPSDAQILPPGQPAFGLSPGRGVASSGGFNTVAAPTPASFGSTRDPKFSLTPAPHPSKPILPLLLLGGGALLLIGGGVVVLLRGHGGEPPPAASSAPAPTSSTARKGSEALVAPTVPSEPPSPADSLPPSPPASERDLPREDTPTRPGGVRAHTAAPRRVAPIAAPHAEPKPAPAEPKPAPAEPKPAPAEPKPGPVKRPDLWGY